MFNLRSSTWPKSQLRADWAYLECASFDPRTRAGFGADFREVLQQWSVDIDLTGFADCVERGLALLAAERGEFLNRSRMTQVVAEDGHIDVFGKAFDQTEGLRQRSAAFEQQPWPLRMSVEQCVKRPTDPEILFDVLRRCAEPLSGRREQPAARFGISPQNFIECGVHDNEA